ncbi:MAG: hypothetical protein JSS51_15180 [Planctomycetes bacterium]|nr:hypothetical protein [Planctomycetota bacterium]
MGTGTYSVLAAIALTAGSAAHAATYNAAADFSTSNNPNGVWSFGGQTSLGSGFTAFGTSGSTAGFDFWHFGAYGYLGYLGAIHNGTGSAIYWGTVVLDPGQLALHPGNFGDYTVARFTAPTSGMYTFSANFIGQDHIIGTSSDVHLLVNNISIFDSAVNGFLATASSGTFTMNLTAGDTIDAAVGYQSGNFYGDTTGLDFNVESVPAPGPLALALLTLLPVRRRSRLKSPAARV